MVTTIVLKRLDYNSIHPKLTAALDQFVVIDLRELGFVKPDGTVLLLMMIRRILSRDGAMVKIRLPRPATERSGGGLSYLARIGFFDKLPPTVLFDERDRLNLDRVLENGERPAKHFTRIMDRWDSVLRRERLSSVVQVFIDFLKRLDHPAVTEPTALTDLLNETFLNLIDHGNPDGEEPPPFFSQIQCYRNNTMNLVVGDEGVGILGSLKKVYPLDSDRAALTAVIKERASRFKNENDERGGGIARIFKLATDLGLSCRLRSGSAEAVARSDKSPAAERISIRKAQAFSGTQLFLWK